MIDDLWYKNAVIYCLSVGHLYGRQWRRAIGDFKGLLRRLDYLQGLGITTIWLMPFQPSARQRTMGYDISDYYGVDPRYGTLGDFVEFYPWLPANAASASSSILSSTTLRMRIPWFRDSQTFEGFAVSRLVRLVRQEARQCQPGHGVSRRAKIHLELRQGSQGLVFPTVFYDFQPDLNTSKPVCAGRDPQDHGLLDSTRRVRFPDGRGTVRDRHQRTEGSHPGRNNTRCCARSGNFCKWAARPTPFILGEANVLPNTDMEYFGKGRRPHPDDVQFFSSTRICSTPMASADSRPLGQGRWLATKTPALRPAQWGLFLRNHDELDLGRLTKGAARGGCSRAFGPDKDMQLYNRGIRRRPCPDAGGDRRPPRTRLQPDVHACRERR